MNHPREIRTTFGECRHGRFIDSGQVVPACCWVELMKAWMRIGIVCYTDERGRYIGT